MIELKRILVPTDFSDTAAVALNYARVFADAFGATLHVLHVVPEAFAPGRTGHGYLPDLTRYSETLKQRANKRLDNMFTEGDRAKYHAELTTRTGSPFVEIVRYAKEQGIDLIVMGTHGRGPVAHMLMGSVAEKVVRKSPCPVLTVRHPEHEFVMP